MSKLSLLVALVLSLSVAACSNKKADDKDKKAAKPAATCDDVELKMREIEPKRTAPLRQGQLAAVCVDEQFSQARIDCTMASTNLDEVAACKKL
jgi:hypothetical protein